MIIVLFFLLLPLFKTYMVLSKRKKSSNEVYLSKINLDEEKNNNLDTLLRQTGTFLGILVERARGMS